MLLLLVVVVVIVIVVVVVVCILHLYSLTDCFVKTCTLCINPANIFSSCSLNSSYNYPSLFNDQLVETY